MERLVRPGRPSYDPRWIVIAAGPPGSSEAISSPGSASSYVREFDTGTSTGMPISTSTLLRSEGVISAVRRTGRLDAHVRQPVGDVRQVLVEERGQVHFAHRLRDADGGARLGIRSRISASIMGVALHTLWRRHPSSPKGAGLTERARTIAPGARKDGPRRGCQRRPPRPRSRRRRGRGVPRAGAPRATAPAGRDRGARTARDGRGPRLRQPVRPAHRSPRARAAHLLRAAPARHADGRARASRRQGGDPVGRAVIGLRRGRAKGRSGALVRPHPGARHLLRAAAHGA